MNTSFSKRLINPTNRASTFRYVEPSFRQNVGPSSRKWIARCSTLLIWLFIGNGGGGRNPKNSWWGCAARFAKSWPYFRPKNVIFTPVFRPRVLTICLGNPEILDGLSNGWRHSVWGASENMGCDLKGCNFCTLFSLFSWFGHSL